MKIKLSASFRFKLAKQVRFIAQDKPQASRNFKNELLNEIRKIPDFPYSYRKSIFFNDDYNRDLVYKGYVITFRIVKTRDSIEVFGFSKYEDLPLK
jgi:plasmid stabilization system protein ParE